MIKKYSLTLLEKAINQALSLDEQSAERMLPLRGKIIEIIIAPLDVHFYLLFDDRLRLESAIDSPPDTVIRSTPLGLIRLSLLPMSKARSLFNDKVRMSGDVELGEKIKCLFNDLDIDWEGHLAQFTGDVVAYQIGSWVRQGFEFQRDVRQSVRRNLSDYVQEELALFPTREESNDFFHDVDVLSLDTARLEAQITQLMDDHELS